MLPAAQRLRRSNDFGAAVRAGRRVSRGPLVVHLTSAEPSQAEPSQAEPSQAELAQAAAAQLPVARAGAMDDLVTTKPVAAGAGSKIPPARAGFIVSRAIGNAVTRNRVRRRLRHLVRERLDQLRPGSTLVVRALPGAADLSYARLAAHLDAALAAARAPRARRGRSA